MIVNPDSRIQQLDVLRGIAIFLVFGSHMYASDLWLQIGWVGVDLFFVLSGFLVSGLLFNEYKKYGKVRPGRFLVRRGFKIYPSFYLLILVTIAIRLKFTKSVSLQAVIAEVFFLQNYLTPLWWHTWSLAVEEHFYLLLALFFFLMQRYFGGRNVFCYIPKATLIITLLIFAIRIWTAMYMKPWSIETHNQPTHLRIDSMLFGVLLAYYHHNKYAGFSRFVTRRAKFIFITSCLFCSCCIFFPGTHIFMITLGFSLLYLGFGGIMITSLYCNLKWPWPLSKLISLLGRLFAYIGIHSYSIYLWHLIIAGIVVEASRRIVLFKSHYLAEFFLYVIGSIVFGIVISKLVEQPVLRLRNKYYL